MKIIKGVSIYKTCAEICGLYIECDKVENDRLVDEIKIFKDGYQIATFFKSNITGYKLSFDEDETTLSYADMPTMQSAT